MKDKINTFIFHAILKSSTYSIVKNELKSSNMDSADFQLFGFKNIDFGVLTVASSFLYLVLLLLMWCFDFRAKTKKDATVKKTKHQNKSNVTFD